MTRAETRRGVLRFATAANAMPKKVLIVDDSASVRQQVRATLVGAGFLVIEAVDGIDGSAKLGMTTDLSLVICDVNMPRMSGIEMVEMAYRDPRRASVPVIMLTTEADPTLVTRAKLAGARGWISKPFRPELLVAAARRLAI